jgi:chemotaxis protein MotB
MKNAPVIIIQKKKGHGHGHHGGAWKVAYADFVTAMMAFFLVLWLVGQSTNVKQAIAGYFRDPGVFEFERSTGILPGSLTGVNSDAPKTMREAGQSEGAAKEIRKALERKASVLKEMVARRPEFKVLKDSIEIQMTDDGLRIELIEKSNSLFFDSGSATLKPQTVTLLAAIAAELGTLDDTIVLEGHTDSRKFSINGGAYTNWELSADRANAARRVMEGNLPPGRINAVRGYADTRLRFSNDPFDPRNRRVSIIVSGPLAPAHQP